MVLKQRLLISAITLAALGAATPASAAPWTKGFVVSSYEYSFRYGGRAGFTREGEIEPGADCRHGSSTHFADDVRTKNAVAQQKWRSQQEVDYIAAPPGLDEVRGPNLTRFYIWDRALSHRGYKKEIETYVNPFAAEDPGQPEVTGRIGDGFNLDGKVKDTDFVSTDGEQGVDHALYRAGNGEGATTCEGIAGVDREILDITSGHTQAGRARLQRAQHDAVTGQDKAT